MKIIVLDRDGVINEDSDDYIKSPEEWLPLPGSLEAIAALNMSGYKVTVATNQSGLGRMLFDEITLANIHQKMCSMVEDCNGFIEGVFYCPHLPDAGCDCRKPKTGLLKRIEGELLTSLAGQYFVGDSLKDLQAARAFSMQPVLVRTGKGRLTESRLDEFGGDPVPVFDNLAQFVEIGLPRNLSGNHV